MVDVRLGWINTWCSANSDYEEWRNATGNWTQPLGQGVKEEEWISACVSSLKPEGWWGSFLEARRRFGEIEIGQRAILMAFAGFNFGALFWLAVTIATFAEMHRQRMYWSRLVLSKLVLENISGTAGLLTLTILWLFTFNTAGNIVCLDGMFASLLTVSVSSSMILSVYLTSQVLVLAIVLDRIQGLANPVAYKLHNPCRRCLIVNAAAIVAGIVPTYAMYIYFIWNLYTRRWAGVPGLVDRKKPKTWQDVVCYRRSELSSQCGWPNYATALDETSGKILSSNTDSRYWYLLRDGPGALCPVVSDISTDGYIAVIFIFGLTFFVGVAVAVAGTKLILLFRRNKNNKVHIIYATKAAQAIADATERHEKTVTIIIILESINVVLATALNVINWAYAVYYGFGEKSEVYSSLVASALIRSFAVMSAQATFGSYPITYIVYRSYRQTLLQLTWLAWTPKPRAVSTLMSAYLAMFSLAILFALLFA